MTIIKYQRCTALRALLPFADTSVDAQFRLLFQEAISIDRPCTPCYYLQRKRNFQNLFPMQRKGDEAFLFRLVFQQRVFDGYTKSLHVSMATVM